MATACVASDARARAEKHIHLKGYFRFEFDDPLSIFSDMWVQDHTLVKDTNAPGLFSLQDRRTRLLHRSALAAPKPLLVAAEHGWAVSGGRREVSRWDSGDNLESVGTSEEGRDG